MEDTIAAVATTIGESSINVIRISGKDSISVANKIFSKDISNVPSHTVHYGFIMEDKEKIDEVFLSVFRAPKSFTTEDIVEISVHGGSASVNKVMELVVTKEMINETNEFIREKVNKLLKNSKKGLLIKNGLKIVIVGKPNVGKSSILNSLLKENKAIVTDIKGTTRDIVEGTLMIDGVKLDILDTAGIRETNDVVEAIGVKRSVDAIDEADLVLFVIDSEDGFSKEDKVVLDKIKDKEILVVYYINDKKDNYN